MAKKLDTAPVIEKIFAIYRDHFLLLTLGAFCAYLVPMAIVFLLAGSASGILPFALSLAVFVVVTAGYQAIVIELVKEAAYMRYFPGGERKRFTLNGLLRTVEPVIVPVICVSLIAAVGISLGLLFFIFPGLFLMTIWVAAIPIVVVERVPIIAAFRHSRELVRGNGWRVFELLLVLLLFAALVQVVLLQIANSISATALSLGVARLIGYTFVGPITALGSVVIYFELLKLHGVKAEEVNPPGRQLFGEPSER